MPFSALLIQVIKKYSCLWDKRDNDYNEKYKREIAWRNVGEEIFEEWHSLDAKEKFYKCCAIKKKWTHIRDYYRKMRIKNLPMMGKKKYIYFDMLDFLDPLYDSKNTKKPDSADSNSTTQEEIDYTLETHSYDNVGECCVAESSTSSKSSTSSNSSPHIMEIEQRQAVIQSEPLREESFDSIEAEMIRRDVLFWNESLSLLQQAKVEPTAQYNESSSLTQEETIDTVESESKKRKADMPSESLSLLQHENEPMNLEFSIDDDAKFLLSLHGDLMRLNHMQKLEFKIGVLQLIQGLMCANQTKRPKLSTF